MYADRDIVPRRQQKQRRQGAAIEQGRSQQTRQIAGTVLHREQALQSLVTGRGLVLPHSSRAADGNVPMRSRCSAHVYAQPLLRHTCGSTGMILRRCCMQRRTRDIHGKMA